MTNVIDQIHREVYSAEKVLETMVLNQDEGKLSKASEDINNVKSLGFGNITNRDIHLDYKKKEQDYNNLNELKEKYPLYKFITEDQLQQICNKYNLIIGWPEIFTAEIPQKNIKEISNFSFKEEDTFKGSTDFRVIREGEWRDNTEEIIRMHRYYSASQTSIALLERAERGRLTIFKGRSRWASGRVEILNSDSMVYRHKPVDDFDANNMANKYGLSISAAGFPQDESMVVVATDNHFDLKGRAVKDNYIQDEVVPYELKPAAMDPIVLKRTKYKDVLCIITAWGEEANDPMVINELYN